MGLIAADFRLPFEVAYGDSYVLYDVLNFERTGIIYRDLSSPPYLAVQYSPAIYGLYSLSRFFRFSNPFLGPRLVAISLFVLSLVMVASIVQKLIRIRAAWIWGLLLVTSVRLLGNWPIQIRGDFLSIFFGLAAMRLLMSRYRYAAALAGLCAGMAVQVKFTLLAAAVSGFLWLLLRRRWSDAIYFALAATIASVGLLFLYSVREPRMISQMTILMPGIKDIRGAISLMGHTLFDPIILFAIAGVASIITSRVWLDSRRWPLWMLLIMFVTLSLGFAFLADLQAGGNINYFFEALLACTPLAVLGVFRLFSLSKKLPWLALFVAGEVLLRFPNPSLNDILHRREYNSNLVRGQREFSALQSALEGCHVLSLDPRIALLDPHPAVTEPYLLGYLRRMGRFDAAPIIDNLANGRFDLFVSIAESEMTWRGVRKFDGRDVSDAVSRSYEPFCTIMNDNIYLRRVVDPGSEELGRKLIAAGCRKISALH